MLHDWRIEEKQYLRHEAKRGRRHAYQSLDPDRTALVVIDMVPFFLNENPYCRGIVSNIERMAKELRSAGGVVAWVLPGQEPPTAVKEEFFGADVAKLYSESGGQGPLIDRLWHEFTVFAEDLLAEKTAASAFFPGRCDLPKLLENRGINTVLIAGTVANVCCESSARDASTLGYRTIMLADANAAVSDADLNATLHKIYRSFGDVRTTSEVVELIRAIKSA